MKYTRDYLYLILIVIGVIAGIYLYINPLCKRQDFCMSNVSEDIRQISKEPHSIRHPRARTKVLNYLTRELHKITDEVEIFRYDSINYIDNELEPINNIYARISPTYTSDTTQYVLLMAHYDSKDSLIVKNKVVQSFGAADDGYGLGVILELCRTLEPSRDNWRQGIKVLFTDSEENYAQGSLTAMKKNPEIFEDVNLVINVEARGVKGPAIMFETSRNPKKVIDLYNHGKDKLGLSLTSLVYRSLPYYTDFTVFKDRIAGMNFSVLDDLEYYHTDKDCYGSISFRSLRHYFNQILPILKHYLPNEEYMSHSCFQSDKNCIYFGYPLLGFRSFTQNGYTYFNLAALTLFFIFLYLFVDYISFKAMWRGSLILLAAMVGYSLIGLLVSLIFAWANGLDFNLFHLPYVNYDSWITVATISIMFYTMVHWMRVNNNNDRKFVNSLFSGTLFLLAILSVATHILIRENFFFLVPLFIASGSMALSKIPYCRWMRYVGSFLVALTGAYLFYILYVALTFGVLSITIFITVPYMFLLILMPFVMTDK